MQLCYYIIVRREQKSRRKHSPKGTNDVGAKTGKGATATDYRSSSNPTEYSGAGKSGNQTAEAESIQNEIKSQMAAQNTDTLTSLDWKVTWKTVTSSRLDSKALKAALPDVAKQFTRQTTARRFVLA